MATFFMQNIIYWQGILKTTQSCMLKKKSTKILTGRSVIVTTWEFIPVRLVQTIFFYQGNRVSMEL